MSAISQKWHLNPIHCPLSVHANFCVRIIVLVKKIIVLWRHLMVNIFPATTVFFLIHLQSLRLWSVLGGSLWRLHTYKNLQQTGVRKGEVAAEHDDHGYDSWNSLRLWTVISRKKGRRARNETRTHGVKYIKFIQMVQLRKIFTPFIIRKNADSEVRERYAIHFCCFRKGFLNDTIYKFTQWEFRDVGVV